MIEGSYVIASRSDYLASGRSILFILHMRFWGPWAHVRRNVRASRLHATQKARIEQGNDPGFHGKSA